MLSDSDILKNLPSIILVKDNKGDVVYSNVESMSQLNNTRAVKKAIKDNEGNIYELCVYPSSEIKHYDNLTGLYTKGTFERELESFYTNSKEEFCVVFSDLDNFKLINDTYGHLNADKILKLVATIIKNNIRSIDFASRFGGDEFVIVLKGINIEDAQNKVGKMQDEINNLNKQFKLNGCALQISASFGIASSVDKDSAFDILESADRALYQAKEIKNAIAIDSAKIR